jgi:hypothetical protein
MKMAAKATTKPDLQASIEFRKARPLRPGFFMPGARPLYSVLVLFPLKDYLPQ